MGIKVFARVRPVKNACYDEMDVKEGENGKTDLRLKGFDFTIDGYFDKDATQEDIYISAGSDQVDSLLDGYSSCIMAYGQTGSGKTHTLYGPDEVLTGR